MFNGLFDEVKEFVQGVPQTQKDIRQIAKTSRQVQSPEVRQSVENIGEELQTFANMQIGLQLLSTIAIVTIAYLTYTRGK
jgi:hypothetical protein